jgi:hypothetical protein
VDVWLFKMIYVLWISFLGIVNLLFDGMEFRWLELIYCKLGRLVSRKSKKVSLISFFGVQCYLFPLFSHPCFLISSYLINSITKRFPDLLLFWGWWKWNYRRRMCGNSELSKASLFSLERQFGKESSSCDTLNILLIVKSQLEPFCWCNDSFSFDNSILIYVWDMFLS